MKRPQVFDISSFIAVLVFGLAGPGVAWAQTLNDSQQPGSVLVFHKFVRGTVSNGTQGELPKSEFEISVVCKDAADCLLLPNYPAVKLMAHWVCPGDPSAPDPRVCGATDYILSTTVNGTIRINPENLGGRTHNVPTPLCDEGFLILWVIGTPVEELESVEGPIKFDGLIGDALLRHDISSVAAYNAYPIQADPALTTGLFTDLDFDGNLDFNGVEYQQVTERIIGTVRYENHTTTNTFLTLLTLDVDTQRPNGRTFVDLNFYNEAEVGISTSTNFVCWQQVQLSDINPGLNTSFGTKGLVQSRGARQEDLDNPGDLDDVTLLGMVYTIQQIPTTLGTFFRSYAYSVYNDGVGQNTEFEPKEEPVITGEGFLPQVVPEVLTDLVPSLP